jgi:hypothetical protein
MESESSKAALTAKQHYFLALAVSLVVSLPFADETIRRWMGFFPALRDGLDVTERRILSHLVGLNTAESFGRLFQTVSSQEEAKFMGDSSFELVLERMANASKPLIYRSKSTPELETRHPKPTEAPLVQPEDGVVGITDHGRLLLSNGFEWKGKTVQERWLGGVHLDHSNLWSLDVSQLTIVRLSS